MSSSATRKSTRTNAGVRSGLVVPESVNRGLGKSGEGGGTAKGKAAGAVVEEKSDVPTNPLKGRKKVPKAVVVPVSSVPSADVVGKKSDVRPNAGKTPSAECVVLGGVPGAVGGRRRRSSRCSCGEVAACPSSKGAEENANGSGCPGQQCSWCGGGWE